MRAPVRTLLGAKGFDTSLTCLRSLVAYSADPVRLVFHEDGSLTDDHRARLAEITPGAEFVGRKEADERVDGLLARHPRCLAARRSGPLFLKLFDVALLNPDGLAYVDSDVFFLRRYTGLFQRPHGSPPVFMTDAAHAYGIRPWRMWPLGQVRLTGRVNTGLIVGWAGGLDLDLLEWLLGRLAGDAAFARRPYWAEQTCWAALAARRLCDLFDPRQVILASTTMRNYHAGVVAIHFVSTYRDRLAAFRDRRPTDEPPVAVATRPARRVGPAGMLWTDICRRLLPFG